MGWIKLEPRINDHPCFMSAVAMAHDLGKPELEHEIKGVTLAMLCWSAMSGDNDEIPYGFFVTEVGRDRAPDMVAMLVRCRLLTSEDSAEGDKIYRLSEELMRGYVSMVGVRGERIGGRHRRGLPRGVERRGRDQYASGGLS